MNDRKENEMKIIDAILSDTAKPAAGRSRSGARRRPSRSSLPKPAVNKAEPAETTAPAEKTAGKKQPARRVAKTAHAAENVPAEENKN